MQGQGIGASWSLVLEVVLAAAAVIDTVQASSFVVSIAHGRSIAKVAARYRSRGYVIQQQNDLRRFLIVATQADAAAPHPAVSPPPEPTASHPGSTGSRAAGPQQQDGSTLSPGGQEPWLVPDHVTAASVGPVPPVFTRAAWGLEQDDSSSVGIASASEDAQTLKVIGGSDVASVQRSRIVYLVGTRPLPAAQRRRLLRQQQRQLRAAVQQITSCPLLNTPDKGLQFANVSEVVPYGIDMVEAATPEMIEISKQHRRKVLYCVIDTGFDPTNSEFRRDSSSGCIAGGTRPNGTPYRCRNSFNLTASTLVGRHGSHVSGTLVAARNGRGVVGVSAEGGLLYHFNAFGPNGTFYYVEVIDAWDDCIAELDYQKAVTNTPDMKMVVSMSFSTDGDMDVVANYLKNVSVVRPDVLFVAAAGNDNDSKPNYPSMSPEVVSVAAVDWTGAKASFSNFGPTVEWAAPGVNTLSTLPMTSASTYFTDTSITLTPFTPPATAPDVLINPPLTIMGASGLGSVTAQMVDCGLGGSTCANATGKICLLQRGGNLLFCTKVTNCLAGFGIAALVYGRADQPQCEQITSVTLVSNECKAPANGWPVVLTASRMQGEYLKGVITSQPSVSVTLNTGGDDYSLGLMSGTSMATPTASGVAGLVWSAHPECTAAELRNAIGKSAQDRGPTGRDDSFGFGIAKALQAHKYLLANPCNSNTNSSDCVGNWTVCTPCQDGTQSSTFVISSPAVGSGKACEAANNTVRNQSCAVGVTALPDSVTVESGVWTDVSAIVSNDRGVIADIDFTAMRTAKNGALRMLPQPEKGTQKTALPKNVVLQYLSPPGFVGNDTFGYIVSDAFGSNSTANVTVTVSPYGCRKSSCVAGGTCTGTGCTCALGSGIFKQWIPNTDRTDRRVLPRLPACRFRTFLPASPLALTGNQATAGALVALDYSVTPVGLTPRCFARTASPVSNVTFQVQADASCAGVTGNLTEVAGTAKGANGCTAGFYRFVTQGPSTAGCYAMRVDLIDTQAKTINILVKAKQRQ